MEERRQGEEVCEGNLEVTKVKQRKEGRKRRGMEEQSVPV